MKKTFTLLALAGMMALPSMAQEPTVTETYVTNANEFKAAFNAHPGTNGTVTKIIVAGAKQEDGSYAQATNETVLGIGNFTPEAQACADGTIVITSNNDNIDNLPRLTLGINMAAQEQGSHFSLVVENVSFEFRSGNLATSGQIVYWNKVDCHADSIIFRNCQITNIPRSLIRTVPSQVDGAYKSDNTMSRFVMEGCKVHDMDITVGNNWPIIYFATQTDEVTIRNNVFYNLPYSKQILTWNYCDATGLDCKITFENNLVVASKGTWRNTFESTDDDTPYKEGSSSFDIISVGGYLGNMADYQINNNIILAPQENVEYTAWGNMTQKGFLTLVEAGESKILSCTGGLVSASNNVVEGYAAWSAGNNKDAEEKRTWLLGPEGSEAKEMVDGTGRETMTEAGLSWSNFYDAAACDFRLEKSHPLYARNIGPSMMYVDKFPEKASLSVTIQGTTFASYTVVPNKENYEIGDVVTITLTDPNTRYCTFTTFKGWEDGTMDNPRTVTLTGSMDLTATYEDSAEGVLSAFTFPSLPTGVKQNNIVTMEANIYEEGYKAVVSQMIMDEETGEYKAVDGTENRFNYRAAKFGEDDAADQMSVISRKTPAAAREAGKPDYFLFTFPTTDKEGITFTAYVGTDNFGYKTQNLDYSLDGTTWTTIGTTTLEARDAEFTSGPGQLYGWNELTATLPAEANNQETVYVRIIGATDAEELYVINTAAGDIDTSEAGMFEYAGSVIITTNGGQGIQTVANTNEQQQMPVYNLMGIRVNAQTKGLLIQGGKKHIVK